jgi:hypothetical protein
MSCGMKSGGATVQIGRLFDTNISAIHCRRDSFKLSDEIFEGALGQFIVIGGLGS